MKKNENQSLWITNISKLNVTLADLGITIKARSSVNLLDKKHYKYTLDQIRKSIESGSIFKKRDKIYERKVPPVSIKSNTPIVKDVFIPSRAKSVFVINEEKYNELDISDEQFAEENIEIVELDSVPLKSKGKK
jgi:hypothetical protein